MSKIKKRSGSHPGTPSLNQINLMFIDPYCHLSQGWKVFCLGGIVNKLIKFFTHRQPN